MAETGWNTKIIDEFRENEGRVGGSFEGSPLLLLHHVGRRSRAEHLSPMMYLADDDDPATFYVFASKAGHPTNPDWYHNVTDSGRARAEVGTQTFDVAVRELEGEERDRVWAEQVRRYPFFSEYAEKTASIRTIPVLALRRS